MKRLFDKIVRSFDPYPMLMKKLFIIIAAIVLFQGMARAQQYPVQVTPQLLPPYSVKISDYYSPGTAGTKLNLLLLLRDFNKPQLQVRLRMSIEGQSVSIRTREDAVFTSLSIESGTPYYLDPSDLAQYFDPNKLDFSGITRQQYEQTGKLPEGFYTFCFEAIEVTTNQSVSNKGCAFAWMTLNEPPILNIPRKAETVVPLSDETVFFQWTPRHTASPTAAFLTDYVFSLVKMDSNIIAPEAAFITPSGSVYTTTVTTTTFQYTGTPLITGSKYAWRVQAIAKNGVEDLASFRNQGYSETFWFTYGSNCQPPIGVSASPQGQRVNIEWTPDPAHLEYKVEYREANNPDAVWFEIGNTLPRVSIADLDTNTIYQYRVGGACEYGRYTFGNLLQFTTNNINATTVPECGIDPNLTDPPQTLLQQFSTGDTIKAGDYKVIVTQITGQTSFSGEGYVKMSWLGDISIAVQFTNIGINTDKMLASGVIETTYDPTEEGLIDVDKFVLEAKDLINTINELLSISIDEKYKNIKGLSDKFLEQAKSELPDSLHAQVDETYEKLLNSKQQYDSLKTALQDCTEPAICDSIRNHIEEAKQLFESAKSEIKQLEEEKKKFFIVYGAIIRDALKSIAQESTDSLPVATQDHSAQAQTLGFDLASISILTDSLITIEFDGPDDVTVNINDFLTTVQQQQYEQYFAAERKLNKARLAKFFSEKMDTDVGAEKLGNELIKDAKKLCNYVYEALKNNIPRPQIVNEAKGVIYERINSIYFEQIK